MFFFLQNGSKDTKLDFLRKRGMNAIHDGCILHFVNIYNRHLQSQKKHFKNVETCTAKSSKCNSQTKPGILHMYIVCMYALTFQVGFHTGKLRILLFPDHLRFFLLMKTQQGNLECLYFPEESQSSVMISNHSPYLYIETSSFTVRDIGYDFSSS